MIKKTRKGLQVQKEQTLLQLPLFTDSAVYAVYTVLVETIAIPCNQLSYSYAKVSICYLSDTSTVWCVWLNVNYKPRKLLIWNIM